MEPNAIQPDKDPLGGNSTVENMADSPTARSRRKSALIVIIECGEGIPCNPCELACRSGAITVGEPITNVPRFSPDKCNGCGLCVVSCPGLAILMIDEGRPDGDATVTLPFEFLPLPQKEEVVLAVDETGNPICRARVIKVLTRPSFGRTSLVTVRVPKQWASAVRAIRCSEHALLERRSEELTL